MNTFVKIFVSLAWVSQILSFQHWCYKNICQNICLSWLIGCHEILSQTLHPALWCHKLLLQILPPPLGCHRVTAIRKVPARAGDRQSPKFAHWAGDGRSTSMGKSLERVLILGWRSSLLQHQGLDYDVAGLQCCWLGTVSRKKSSCSFGFCPNEGGRGGPCTNFSSAFHKRYIMGI